MARKTMRWDATDYLTSEQAIGAYLDAVLTDGDFELVKGALDDVARARRRLAMARGQEATARLRQAAGN